MKLPEKLYRSYVERRKADLATLEAALSAKEIEPFKRIGHQIRGNAASFGFTELEQVGDRLEALSLETLAQEGPSILDELKKWIAEKKF